MKTNTLTAILILFTMFLSGCQSPPSPNPITFVESVKLSPKADRLNNATETILKHSKVPEVTVETAKINVVATELRADDVTVQGNLKLIKQLQDENAELKSETTKSRNRMYSVATWIGGILALIGAVCLVASIKIPFIGGIGAGFALLGIVIISSVQFLSTYDWAVIVIGLLCVLGVIGYGVYSLIKSHRNNKEKEVALVDMVKTVELMKPQVMNWESLKKTVSQIHNPATQNLVKKIKESEVNTIAR